MPANRAAKPTQKVSAPKVIVPEPEIQDEELEAVLSTPYDITSKEEERTHIFSLSQYIDKLKEQYTDVKQFDIFTFTDDRTELRTEKSKADNDYQIYIIQPLLINCILKDGKTKMIKRSDLIKIFEKHYLKMFYSKFDLPKKDFKINIIQVDAMPTIKGDYTNYKSKWRPIEDSHPISAKLIKLYENLSKPIVPVYQPKRIQEFDYNNLDIDIEEIGDDTCV